MKVLVVMPVTEEHKVILQNAAPEAEFTYTPSASVTKELAQSADIIVGNLAPSLIQGSKNLKLMQLNSAGTDGYTAEGIMPPQAVLANATGAYGLAISEHMLGAVLCMMKKLDKYRDNMHDSNWKDEGPVTSIYGSKTLVVGFGDIGNEFGQRMHALGSSVSAIKRVKTEKPEYIEKLCLMDQLYECLEEADIVAACLPGTPETYKIFNAEAFSHMKKGAFFVNVGRGNAVDSDALCDALNNGQLAGASLDVTDPEPLPADSRLWSTPGVLITPHVSGGYHLKATHDRIIQIAARNIIHCLKNEPYENEVDYQTGYRKIRG